MNESITLAESTQTFVINEDGSIFVQWINPEFSDLLLDTVYSKEERQELIDLNGDHPKIYCG
jgi:hypothetical protein